MYGVWWMVVYGVCTYGGEVVYGGWRCVMVRWCMSGAIVVGDKVVVFMAMRWCVRSNPNPQCLSL